MREKLGGSYKAANKNFWSDVIHPITVPSQHHKDISPHDFFFIYLSLELVYLSSSG